MAKSGWGNVQWGNASNLGGTTQFVKGKMCQEEKKGARYVTLGNGAKEKIQNQNARGILS